MQTFLFTDIEGSTSRWQEFPAQMPAALERHDSIITECIEEHGGRIVKHTGDGFMAVFPDSGALSCAADIQRRMFSSDWSAVNDLRIRIGIHSGEASHRGDDYFGIAINRAARIMAAAWGGQVVLSDAVLTTDRQPEGTDLQDAGVHILKDLLEPQRLYILVNRGLPDEFPPLRTISLCAHNLPVQPTPFVGRKRELAEIERLLTGRDCRLLTLLAPGGTGKSRLALQAAAELIHDFPDGAFFVPLEEASSEAQVVAAIASAMSMSFSGPCPEESQLHEHLEEKECLLVLDNFEHIVVHAPLVSRMLRESGRIRVMATSRHRLNLKGEWMLEVEGMPVPGDVSRLEDIDASSLFLQGALRADPSFSPGPGERRSIAGICRLLEGSPLAIELAAAWVRLLSCSEIEKELEASLDILETSAADAPGRQGSLEAVFEYSWELMSPEERSALASAAVFRGDFDRNAFREVTGAGLRMIGRLTDMSLVRRTGEGRFQLHGLLRSCAEKKQESLPGGEEGLRRQHALYYHGYLAALRDRDPGGALTGELDRVEEDIRNFRAAWQWSLDDMSLVHLRDFTRALGEYSHKRSHFTEARELMAEGLARLGEHAFGDGEQRTEARKLEAEMLDRLGLFESLVGRYPESLEHHTKAREIAIETGSMEFCARVLNNLGNTSYRSGDYRSANRWWSEALEQAREQCQTRGIAAILSNLAGISRLTGNIEEAMSRYREALDAARETSDVFTEAGVLLNLGGLEDCTGDTAAAVRDITKALEIRRGIGDRRGESFCLNWLARIVERTDPGTALGMHMESVRLASETGDVRRQAESLGNLCNLRISMGDLEGASADLDGYEALAGKIDPCFRGSILELKSKLLLKQGMVREAFDTAAQARARYMENGEGDSGFDALFCAVMAMQGEGATGQVRDDLLGLLRELSGGEPVTACPGALMITALLLQEKGEEKAASRCFRAAATRERYDLLFEDSAARLAQLLGWEADGACDTVEPHSAVIASVLELLGN